MVDLREASVERAGATQALTTLEVRLLRYLVDRLDQDVSREALLTEIWGYHPGTVTRAVDSTVTRLRTKIERNPAEPEHLLTVFGHGYRLQVEAVEATAPSLPIATEEADTFFGREPECAEVAALLAAHRLVTVLGPGGMGKSRLARRVVSSAAAAVWSCSLDGAASDQQVDRLVTAALPGGAAASIDDALASLGSGLLLLDGVDAFAPAVADRLEWWLRRAPKLRVLVTSRQRLGLPEERCVELGPLDADAGAALFADRARRLGTAVGPEQPGVHALVERLEGHPLAIELAAAMTDLFTAQKLVERLRSSTRVLDQSEGTSLAGVFESSWSQLEPAERAALGQLCVFEGGFSVEAAEVVLAETALSQLRQLRARSLVRRLPGPHGRLAVYEVLRSEVRARLEPDQVRAMAEVHRRWALDEVRRHLGSPGAIPSVETLRWLHEELDNLAQALLGTPPEAVGDAALLAVALYHVLVPAGQGAQALAQLDGVLARAEQLPPGVAAEVLRCRVNAARLSHPPAELWADLARAEAFATQAGDPVLQARIAVLRGVVEAQAGLEDAAIARVAGAVHHLPSGAERGRALLALARLSWDRGRLDEAEASLVEAEAGLRGGESPRLYALVSAQLGQLEVESGRSSGLKRLEGALDLHRSAADAMNIASVLMSLGTALCHQRRFADALAALDEALVLVREHGDRHGELLARLVRAPALAGDGELEQALAEVDAARRLGTAVPALAAATEAVAAVIEAALGLPAARDSARRAARFHHDDARAAWLVRAACAATGETPPGGVPAGDAWCYGELVALRALLPVALGEST